VIKFVSDLRQVGGFLLVLRFPPPIKLTATTLLKYLSQLADIMGSAEKFEVSQEQIMLQYPVQDDCDKPPQPWDDEEVIIQMYVLDTTGKIDISLTQDIPGTPVSSTNKTYRHDITEILLKVALNTITHPTQQ
jgi:hypothetical protein